MHIHFEYIKTMVIKTPISKNNENLKKKRFKKENEISFLLILYSFGQSHRELVFILI